MIIIGLETAFCFDGTFFGSRLHYDYTFEHKKSKKIHFQIVKLSAHLIIFWCFKKLWCIWQMVEKSNKSIMFFNFCEKKSWNEYQS